MNVVPTPLPLVHDHWLLHRWTRDDPTINFSAWKSSTLSACYHWGSPTTPILICGRKCLFIGSVFADKTELWPETCLSTNCGSSASPLCCAGVHTGLNCLPLRWLPRSQIEEPLEDCNMYFESGTAIELLDDDACKYTKAFSSRVHRIQALKIRLSRLLILWTLLHCQ